MRLRKGWGAPVPCYSAAASSAAGSAAAGFRGCGLLSLGFLFRFSQNLHRDVRSDFAVQADGNLEFAEALDGVAQLNLAAVDLVALRSQFRGDVRRGD